MTKQKYHDTGSPDAIGPPDINDADIDDRRQAVKWLRNVLTSAVEISSLPQWLIRNTASVIRRMPDKYLSRWAETLNIDIMTLSKGYPDLPLKINSAEAKQIIEDYLQNHGMMILVIHLRRLMGIILRLFKAGRLPLEKEVLEQQVTALALADFTASGTTFGNKAINILRYGKEGEHILADYCTVLKNGDSQRLAKLQNLLENDPYNSLINQLITEFKRYLGLDQPKVCLYYGSRNPLWELLWQKLFSGGDYDRSQQ